MTNEQQNIIERFTKGFSKIRYEDSVDSIEDSIYPLLKYSEQFLLKEISEAEKRGEVSCCGCTGHKCESKKELCKLCYGKGYSSTIMSARLGNVWIEKIPCKCQEPKSVGNETDFTTKEEELRSWLHKRFETKDVYDEDVKDILSIVTKQ